jgi:predicted SnoaL-like aldol condensation-catalyzing enzyme
MWRLNMSEPNLALVQQFLDHVLAGRSEDALILVGENHVEHSATIPAGRDGVRLFVESVASRRNEMEVTVHRMIADDRHVVVHLHTRWPREDRDTVAIDIFRVDGDRIVEHWDVVQQVTTGSVNSTPIL